MTTLNMDEIVRVLRDEHGIGNAYVAMTGGGVATIFAGPTREEPDYGIRYAAVAGPGSYGWDTGPSVADTREFFIGPDDYGDAIAAEAPADSTEVEVAALIAAQVAAAQYVDGAVASA